MALKADEGDAQAAAGDDRRLEGGVEAGPAAEGCDAGCAHRADATQERPAPVVEGVVVREAHRVEPTDLGGRGEGLGRGEDVERLAGPRRAGRPGGRLPVGDDDVLRA
jgi:hypothetical protein